MAPIFASADIAALVTAFPPPSPSKNQPTLVRSLSGEHLRDSRKALSSFRTLLETAPSRIRLNDLHSRLDIEETNWLLECYDEPLYYGKDSQSLIPKPVTDDILDDVSSRLRQRVHESSEISSTIDIAEQALENMLGSAPDRDIQEFIDQDAGGKRYFYSRVYTAEAQERLKSIVAESRIEGIGLSDMFPDMPMGLLKALADNTLSGSEAERGSFQVSDEKLVFVPAGYAASLEKKQRAAKEKQVQDLFDELRERQWCCLPTGSQGDSEVLQALSSRFSEVLNEDVVELQTSDERSVAFMLPKKLDEALETLRAAAPQEARKAWHERKGPESEAALRDATLNSLEGHQDTEPPKLVLQSTSHRTELESTITDTFTLLELEDYSLFSHLLRERLLAPITLYTNGIATVVNDVTLKQHLEEHLSEHFRREIIPAVIETLRARRVLLDKGRKRDVDKMQQACAESKALSDIHTAVTKTAKKQKISLPDPEPLEMVKRGTLQQKVKAMRKMTRGSDLLQNLIWVLLAQKSDGLFISSGKDTTRMIKQYHSLGDADTGRQLEAWRDMLKAGKETKEDFQNMREMAARVMEDMAQDNVEGGHELRPRENF